MTMDANELRRDPESAKQPTKIEDIQTRIANLFSSLTEDIMIQKAINAELESKHAEVVAQAQKEIVGLDRKLKESYDERVRAQSALTALQEGRDRDMRKAWVASQRWPRPDPGLWSGSMESFATYLEQLEDQRFADFLKESKEDR
jgi:hypothetical protein